MGTVRENYTRTVPGWQRIGLALAHLEPAQQIRGNRTRSAMIPRGVTRSDWLWLG